MLWHKVQGAGGLGEADPYFSDVSLLLSGDGVDGSTTFTDSSLNNFTATPIGNSQIDTGIVKYGTGSMLFDGSGDWLTIPNNSAFDFGSGDFTLESWVYTTTNTPTAQLIYGKRLNNLSYAPILFGVIKVGSEYKSFILGSTSNTTWTINGSFQGGSVTVPLNTWVHLAVVRSGTTFINYVNGVNSFQVNNISGPLITNTNLSTVGAGAEAGSNSPWYGHIDDLRITKGVARYTSNFTPPTGPFPTQ